jgi:hypothetical protein
LILAASVVLLVPGARARPAAAPDPATPRSRRFAIALAGAFVIFTVLPLTVVAATPRLHDGGSKAVRLGSTLISVTSLDLRTVPPSQEGSVRLSWEAQRPAGSSVFYNVLRTNPPGDGVACAGKPAAASDDCELGMASVATTETPFFVDHPGRGTWVYRIGVAANWLNDPSLGDIYVVSPPALVTVP